MNSIIVLGISGILLLYFGLFNKNKILIPFILIALIAALFFANSNTEIFSSFFNHMIISDKYSVLFNSSMIGITILIILLANFYYKNVENNIAEIYTLLLFSLAGALMMTSFANMIMLFIGIETLSIPLYVLAGSKKFSIKSNEASFKYFILGAFATALFLLGITLIYGVTGSFYLDKIASYTSNHITDLPLIFQLGILLVIIAMAFKVAAVPFHFWAPDVYDGSPTFITLFMATIVKTASIAAFYRLFSICFVQISQFWQMSVWGIIILTLLIANISAIRQTETKRLLAYSSISHTGFLQIAIVALNQISAGAIFYYTIAYSLATISAFAVLIVVKNNRQGDGTISTFNGLIKTNPFLAIVMTIALFSLAGIPVTAGFFAKYLIFFAAIKNGFIWLVLIAIFAALIGIYYYFRIIIAMYFKTGEYVTIQSDISFNSSLLICSVLTLVFGILPTIITQLM